jgi:hypothetical protein
MSQKAILEKSRPGEPTVRQELDSLNDDDDLMDFMNLTSARTGVGGIIFISTHMGARGPRVKYFEKTGPGQPSFSVSIELEPKVIASSMQDQAVGRRAAAVIAWVKLNRDPLREFCDEGEFWLEDRLEAFKDSLKKVPAGA